MCATVKAPTPKEEDRRRICRERKTLVGERVEHVNRINLDFPVGCPVDIEVARQPSA